MALSTAAAGALSGAFYGTRGSTEVRGSCAVLALLPSFSWQRRSPSPHGSEDMARGGGCCSLLRSRVGSTAGGQGRRAPQLSRRPRRQCAAQQSRNARRVACSRGRRRRPGRLGPGAVQRGWEAMPRVWDRMWWRRGAAAPSR
jgi:hypothetical protein